MDLKEIESLIGPELSEEESDFLDNRDSENGKLDEIIELFASEQSAPKSHNRRRKSTILLKSSSQCFNRRSYQEQVIVNFPHGWVSSGMTKMNTKKKSLPGFVVRDNELVLQKEEGKALVTNGRDCILIDTNTGDRTFFMKYDQYQIITEGQK